MAFDHARGTLGWPAGIDGRGLRNKVVRDFEGGLGVEHLKKNFQEAAAKGDADGMVVWAGTGIGLMDEIKDAGVRIPFPSYDVSVLTLSS